MPTSVSYGRLRVRRMGLCVLLGALLLVAIPNRARAAGPSIATAGASATGPTTAEVTGDGDANGMPTTLYADYALASEEWCVSEGAKGTPQHTASQSIGEGNAMLSELIVQLAGLAPGSEYCAELVAENAEGVAHGGQRRFTTLPVPSVESESTEGVTATDATVQAEVDLHGIATGAYYQFQVVSDPSEYSPEILCPTSSPGFSVCAGTIAASALPIGYLPANTAQPGALAHASLDLASAGVTLQPSTTYHYRVLVARRVPSEDVLEWEPPVAYGPDETFTTLAVPTGSGTPPAGGSGTPPPGDSGGSGTQPPGSVEGSGSSPTQTMLPHGKHHHKHHRHHHHHRRHRHHHNHHPGEKRHGSRAHSHKRHG